MKQKKNLPRANLVSWLTSRFLLIIRDEENFEEKTTIQFTYMRLLVVSVLVFSVCMGLSFLLVTTVLNKWFDPRTESGRTSRTLIEIEERVDSLLYEMKVKERYLENFQNVLSGKVDLAVFESAPSGQTPRASDVDLKQVSAVDSMFRKAFEEEDYEQLILVNSTRDKLQQLYFFSPLRGIISQRFNIKEGHYGLDIVAKKDEPIKAIADGTVILASWTQDSGHVIGVQHGNELVSFYKHNSVLLKKVGDPVNAGDIVAIIGNSGELTDGPHLHFELWYEGTPVNPEDFIMFE